MRTADVLYKGKLIGILTQNDEGKFSFRYEEEWLKNPNNQLLSLSFPLQEEEFYSENLFPFFYHLLPEGMNKKIICRELKIDENDDFGLLLNTANNDSIGAIKIVRK